MNARTLITAGAIVALAAPAAATAKSIPAKRRAEHIAMQVTKRLVPPRVLCICEISVGVRGFEPPLVLSEHEPRTPF